MKKKLLWILMFVILVSAGFAFAENETMIINWDVFTSEISEKNIPLGPKIEIQQVGTRYLITPENHVDRILYVYWVEYPTQEKLDCHYQLRSGLRTREGFVCYENTLTCCFAQIGEKIYHYNFNESTYHRILEPNYVTVLCPEEKTEIAPGYPITSTGWFRYHNSYYLNAIESGDLYCVADSYGNPYYALMYERRNNWAGTVSMEPWRRGGTTIFENIKDVFEDPDYYEDTKDGKNEKIRLWYNNRMEYLYDNTFSYEHSPYNTMDPAQGGTELWGVREGEEGWDKFTKLNIPSSLEEAEKKWSVRFPYIPNLQEKDTLRPQWINEITEQNLWCKDYSLPYIIRDGDLISIRNGIDVIIKPFSGFSYQVPAWSISSFDGNHIDWCETCIYLISGSYEYGIMLQMEEEYYYLSDVWPQSGKINLLENVQSKYDSAEIVDYGLNHLYYYYNEDIIADGIRLNAYYIREFDYEEKTKIWLSVSFEEYEEDADLIYDIKTGELVDVIYSDRTLFDQEWSAQWPEEFLW